jgi:hypothetical protein
MEPLRPSAILQFIQNHMHGIDSTGSKETLAAPTVTGEGSPKPGSELRRTAEPVTGLKVLLVDDNIVNCQVGQRLVKRLTHECHIATSGPEAIQKFNEEHWDVVSGTGIHYCLVSADLGADLHGSGHAGHGRLQNDAINTRGRSDSATTATHAYYST